MSFMNEASSGKNTSCPPCDDRRCTGCAVRATRTVLGINVGLFLVKFVFALDSMSRSLLADSLESLAGIAISGLVLFSLHVAAKDNDDHHPYGYGKIEFLASAVIHCLLLMMSLGFLGASIWELLTVGPERPPSMIAVAAAALSIAGNWLACSYFHCASNKLKSRVIMANAQVSWVDAMTSCAVIVAVVAANLGWYNLDPIVGTLIGFWIAKGALDGLEQSVKELLDFSPGTESARIGALAKTVAGSHEIRDVKTRLVGRKLWVDIEVAMQKDCALGEGLRIVQKLKQAVLRGRRDIAEVSVRLCTMP